MTKNQWFLPGEGLGGVSGQQSDFFMILWPQKDWLDNFEI